MREAVYTGYCPSCEGIVISGWDSDVTLPEVVHSWWCPQCGWHPLEQVELLAERRSAPRVRRRDPRRRPRR